MNKNRFTVMLIPHWGKGPVTVSLSLKLIRFISFCAAAAVMVLAFLGYDYLIMQSKMEELHRLEALNELKDAQLEYFAKETRELTLKMNNIEEMDREVRKLLEMDEFNLSKTDLTLKDRAILPSRGLSIGGEDLGTNLEQIELSADYAFYQLEAVKNNLPAAGERLEELLVLIEEEKTRLAGTPSIWPTQGRITSPFGYRRSPFTRRVAFHEGIDIGASRGTPVKTAADGIVTMAKYNGGFGRTVKIKHPYGHVTVYAHLTRYDVKEGDEVKQGEVIGYVGSTGYSTGSHLHYEVHVGGSPADPMNFLPE
ncbi:MAG: peptidase M23 [Firmicutes bacterium HGW-Firmicutes-13]|nr:MAG: peptidase M23 [Firmicutes bacterium HGW-Firmicutes-13]